MLHVDKKSLHGRWYLFCNSLWAEFTSGQGASTEQTNLCVYFWIAIVAPIFIVFAHLSVLAFVGYVFLYYSISTLTPVGYGIEIGIVALIVGIFFGIRKITHMIKKTGKDQKKKGFFNLISEYTKAKKDRVCPIIRLED